MTLLKGFYSLQYFAFNPPMAKGGGGGVDATPPKQVFPIFLRNGKIFFAN